MWNDECACAAMSVPAFDLFMNFIFLNFLFVCLLQRCLSCLVRHICIIYRPLRRGGAKRRARRGFGLRTPLLECLVESLGSTLAEVKLVAHSLALGCTSALIFFIRINVGTFFFGLRRDERMR